MNMRLVSLLMAILPVYALTVYDTDDSTVLFDVSTDPAHARPYLKAPTGFPEQEVDFAKGAASIGQLNVHIVDVRQTATDQSTGYVTGQLADAGGGSQLNGHRALLTEDVGSGPVTVLDGVIRSVRLLDTWASYELELRDIRERERRTKAFETTDSPTILPRGVLNGYGVTVNGVKYPVPATQPLTATYRGSSTQGIVDFTNADPVERVLTEPMREALANVAPLSGEPETLVYDYWKLLWRDKATGGAYTTVAQVSHSGAGVDNRTLLTEEDGRLLWLVVNNPVSGATLPTDGQEIEVIVQYDGPPTEEWPLYLEGLTVGELIRDLYRGDHSAEDPRIRYDETALLALKTPIRGRITEPIDDLRAWAEEHAYPIARAAPTLNAAGEISPVSYTLPDASVSLVTLNDSNCAPAGGGWSHGVENAVNVVRVTHKRDYRVRPKPGERLALSDQIRSVEVTTEYRSQSSIDLLGEQPLEIKSDLLRSIGTADGEPLSGDVVDETGTQVALSIGRLATDRWVLGGQYFALKGDRSDSNVEGLKVGSWVSVGVSWTPDYITGTRGANRLAQVVGRRNLNGAWCMFTLIDAGSDNAPLGQPTLGTITANTDGVVSIPVDALATGSPDARVDFAVNATEPASDSELWTFLDRADQVETLTTHPLPAGATCWVRARSEAPGERPSAYTNAVSVAIPQTARIFYLEVELSDLGVPTLNWTPNQFCLGVRIAYQVHQPDTEPTFPGTVDVDATLGTHTLSGLQVSDDEIISAQVTAYDGWTGSAVTGTAGPVIEVNSETGVSLSTVISVQATDELLSVGVSGGEQAWKDRLILLCGPATQSLDIAVGDYVEIAALDDPGWPSQLVPGWNYNLDVDPSTTVHDFLKGFAGADIELSPRYDEGNLLEGGRSYSLTITPYSQPGSAGVAGKPITLLTKDFFTSDAVGFRTTETGDRRVDNKDTPGLGGFDLDLDADANGFAFEWTNVGPGSVDVSQVRFYVKATGSPGGPDDLTADIYQDSAGLPGTFIAESTPVDPTTIGATYEAVTFDFPTPVTVADGATIHIGVVHASGDASNYLSVEADDSGSHAELNGTWAAGVADREPLWRLYVEDEIERFARRALPGANVKSAVNPSTGELEFALKDELELTADNPTGEGLLYGVFIITDSAAVDTAAGLAIRNIGHSDNLYLEVSGKPTGASAPTGLGVDLNKEAGGTGEESSSMAGFGIQIHDHSTTDQGVDGPHMIYLLKSGNPNSEHPALEIAANRNAIRVIDDPGVAGYNGALALISHFRADTGAERWRFTADGFLLFIEDGRGLLFQFGAGNQGAIKLNDTDDTIDVVLGPNGVRFLDNAGSNVNVQLTDEGTINMRVRTSDPGNAVRGTLAYADGTSWDPGSGEGVYRYNGTSWVFLG